MKQTLVSTRLQRGRALRLVLLSVAALAVLGLATYQFFLARPGEAATAWIPADADVVITLDTNPSQRQMATFLKITAALEREGIAKKLDESLAQAFEGKPIAAEIQPHLQKSFAMAMWTGDGKPTETLTLLSVDSPTAVRSSLQKHATESSAGIYGLPGANGRLFASVLDAYLVLASSEATLARVERVRAGEERSVSRLAAFADARSALPADANGMVFVAPRVFEKLASARGSTTLKGTSWMAYGATIVPEGIQFDYQCPINPAQMRTLAAVGSVAPFDLAALKALPSGAFGVAGYSQGGRYWDAVKGAASEDPAVKGVFADSLRSFEKETGISVAQDLAPALLGEQVVAVYPGPSGNLGDVDGVLLLTDSHGANPAALADKVRALIVRKSAEGGKGVKFVESKVGGATVWELDTASRDKLLDALPSPTGAQGSLGVGVETSDRWDQPPPRPERPAFLENKSFLYAQIGNSVLVASSRALLQRALGAPRSGENLAEEPVFASATSHLIDGSQAILLVNLKRIMQAVEPSLTESMRGSPFQASDLTALFGDGLTPLVAGGKFDGKLGSGRLLLPLDFDRLISLIGGSMDSAAQSRSAAER